MTNLHNAGMNDIIQRFAGQAGSGVLNAIQNASASTGVDFSYLVQQAKAESSFNPEAKAKTSSASGLYQFIKSTWLDMVNRHGDKYGIETEGMSKSEILDLRFDPEIASNMAAEFAAENKSYLERTWGGDVGSTELYFAHFMGAGGAGAFLKAKDENPLRIGADLFPKAANANRNVFYDSDTGKPRTLAEIYNFFDKKFAVQGDSKTASNSNANPVSPTAVTNALIEGVTDMKVPPRKPIARPAAAASTYNEGFYNTGGQSIVRVKKANPVPLFNLVKSPVELMIMAEMGTPYQSANAREDEQNARSSRSKLFSS